MAIKGGQILHVAGGPTANFVVDRIQTGGITGINVNEDRLEELGNYEAIGTLRDIPDLTFEIESYDVTTELESLLTGGDNTEGDGTLFNLANFVPLDVLSPFKASGVFTVDGSVIVPFLSLESMSYNFSLGDPATMTATMRGDSVFYVKGSPYAETFDGGGDAGPDSYANTALKSTISGTDYYALSVMVQYDGSTWTRARLGTDYTNTTTQITWLDGPNGYPPVGTDNIKVVYGSATQATYLQTVHDTVNPAGVRGRDVYVRLSDGAATPVWTDWLGVQSANVDWRVTLERDEEFGNPQVVAQDFDVPEVSGSVTMKPSTVTALFTQIQSIAGLTGTDIANATQDPPELGVEIKITDPSDGSTTKTLVVDDAKFVLPQLQGSVGSKLESDFSFTSSSGVLNVYKADPA
jgi:hypothetical protein